MRTVLSPVSPDFVTSVGYVRSLLIQTKELLVLGVVVSGMKIGPVALARC